MRDLGSLRLGCVKYLNARPLIRGWPGKVTFDHPAALSDQLRRGDLEVALVSSFEFLRNPIYRVVDSVSVSCDGPVYSVVVAHHGDLAEIEEIALDPASLTSVALLRTLLAESGLRPRLVEASAKGLNPRSGLLLIGDQAIRFRHEHAHDFKFWDLGEEWKQANDVPFVFALWLIRPEVPDSAPIADKLRGTRDANLRDLEQLVAAEKDFNRDFCRRYFREHLRFNFGEREKRGLETFANACAKHGLIPNREFALNLV